MRQLIRITTIYNEIITCVELRRNKIGIYVYKDEYTCFIPFDDIQFIDIIGNVVEK